MKTEIDRGSGLLEVPFPPELADRPELRGATLYRMGKLSVIVNRETAGGESRWHMSVAHPDRLPAWEEIKYIRRRLLPEDAWFCLPWPPEEFWLNVHDNCLHLWEIRDSWLIEQMRYEGSDPRSKIVRGP